MKLQRDGHRTDVCWLLPLKGWLQCNGDRICQPPNPVEAMHSTSQTRGSGAGCQRLLPMAFSLQDGLDGIERAHLLQPGAELGIAWTDLNGRAWIRLKDHSRPSHRRGDRCRLLVLSEVVMAEHPAGNPFLHGPDR
jgi:hypothetical protein